MGLKRAREEGSKEMGVGVAWTAEATGGHLEKLKVKLSGREGVDVRML
jgi:tRNA U54 and U55 pseudouridine synthase Pus10